MNYKFLIIFIYCVGLYGNKNIQYTTPLNTYNSLITLEWLNSKPRSIAKDFYIWQYLDQDISPDQAIQALGQAKNVNNKLFFRYAKKIKHDETYAVAQCMKAKAKNLITKDAYCIDIGLTTYKATKLNQNEIEDTIEKLKNKYPKKASILKIINSPIPFTKLISSPNEIFFETFNECGGKFREKYFNYKIPKRTITRLKKEKEFAQTIKLIVTNSKLTKIQESLLNLDEAGLSHASVFFLAINAIQHKENEKALKYLRSAFNTAYYRFDKDKVLFWQYLITKNNEYLEKLSKSWDINLYSLYAMEQLNKQPTNIIYDLQPTTNNKHSFNISNPFFWLPILRDIKKITDDKLKKYQTKLDTNATLPHLAFIKERASKYRKSYFITPYSQYLKDLALDRQAIIYALGRQESRFIPSSISPSYAMGIMQIMPFLSKSIAKELKEFYNIYEQLVPSTNLKYANHHLDFLEARLKHPLLVAYAYNGGIGFTSRLLKNGLFKRGDYEPFLSMELIPYDETKRYGKKVLANYYVYKNHLDRQNRVKLSTLIETLN